MAIRGNNNPQHSVVAVSIHHFGSNQPVQERVFPKYFGKFREYRFGQKKRNFRAEGRIS